MLTWPLFSDLFARMSQVLMGHIVFGEILGGRQLLGAVLLLLGALLVSTAQTQQESVVPCKEKKTV